jgi:hypothetical protein
VNGTRVTDAIIAAVLGQAVADARASGIMILEPETPEGLRARRIAVSVLGDEGVFSAPEVTGGDADTAAEQERRRAGARVIARQRDLLLAHPANKTALLLCRSSPPESFLPLGDLYASHVLRTEGSCTLPDDVSAMAAAAGGLAVLDAVLSAWLEERRPLDEAALDLPVAARPLILSRLERNRADRRWPRRVPKLGPRTLWIDVFA